MNAEITETVSKHKREELADKLSLLGDSTRLEIVCCLLESERVCVSAVAEKINISVANASYHLNMLADAGLCQRDQHAQQVFYSLEDNEIMHAVKKWLCKKQSQL